jgi:hypothetical protein
MESFFCPKCAHKSEYDPMAGPAICSKCGYTPPTDVRLTVEPRAKLEPPKRPQRSKEQPDVHLSLLDELLSHWDGTHVSDRAFHLATSGEARTFFKMYERALVEGGRLQSGGRVRYVRSHRLPKKAILWFVAAYLLLRRGERAKAAQHLHDLTQLHPEFPDPWVWLAATSDDPAQQIDYLENAVLLESAHPLARDALAIAQGRVSRKEEPRNAKAGGQVQVADCPQCGGILQYKPGTTVVECQYCGSRLPLRETNLIDREAMLIGDLQLQRRLEGHVWKEVQRLVHCQACGAELTMTHHLTKQCIFCGSTTVRVKDSRQSFEQPDGFLPFKLDEGQAALALDKAQRSRAQRLRTWWSGQEQEFTRLQAVYLPFWVFDGFVEVRKRTRSQADADALQALSQLTGERVRPDSLASGVWLRQQIAPSRRQRVSLPSKDLLIFDNLLYPAMDFPPSELLKQTFPFGLGGLVPYEPRLLADWPAALYHRDVEAVVKEAYNAMLYKAVWRKRRQVLGQAGDLDQLRRMFQVTTVTYQLVLLPVWVGLAQREHERRLVLVNGQTGKVVLSSPVRRRSKE